MQNPLLGRLFFSLVLAHYQILYTKTSGPVVRLETNRSKARDKRIDGNYQSESPPRPMFPVIDIILITIGSSLRKPAEETPYGVFFII